jgi:prepilin-type N-terminal cleavage/methylation domain-containing protein
MKRRRGFSLVECVVAIGLIAVAFTTVAVATGGIRRALARLRADVEIELAIERLAIQLRADAHEALAADLPAPVEQAAPAGSLRLTLNGQRRIDYSIRADRIERVVRRQGTVAHRETYRLPESPAACWALSSEGAAPIVALKIAPAPPGGADSIARRGVEIQAAVGLLRLLPPGEMP